MGDDKCLVQLELSLGANFLCLFDCPDDLEYFVCYLLHFVEMVTKLKLFIMMHTKYLFRTSQLWECL
jgi:hypothetical protein